MVVNFYNSDQPQTFLSPWDHFHIKSNKNLFLQAKYIFKRYFNVWDRPALIKRNYKHLSQTFLFTPNIYATRSRFVHIFDISNVMNMFK